MIDFARITVIGGKGGDGSGSFISIKRRKRGKADGGDGGRGGNVYIVATRDMNTLEPFRFVKEYKAKNGSNGLSRTRKGAEGDDLVIKVPAGTLVKSPKGDFDLLDEEKKILIGEGGKGGKGNVHLRDEFGRRPLSGGKGEEGETLKLVLELKLIADVGLIGLPNAGKSTLLAKLTSASPKIADYPFTTLEPNLGVLVKGGKRIVIADIPGLIEGASKGKGLGDLFLRHIERTKLLVHLIDISQDGDLWQIYQKVRVELKNYSKELVKKREIIVFTKADLLNKSQIENTTIFFSLKRKRVIAISSHTGFNIERLIVLLYSI